MKLLDGKDLDKEITRERDQNERDSNSAAPGFDYGSLQRASMKSLALRLVEEIAEYKTDDTENGCRMCGQYLSDVMAFHNILLAARKIVEAMK